MGIFRFILLCGAVVLAPACTMGSATIGYSATAQSIVQAEEMSFRVYRQRNGNGAEAHRVNIAFPPPSRLRVMALAVQAMTKATGCSVKEGSLVGDQAIVKAELACPSL